MEGEGVLFDANGLIYVGAFKQGKQHGEGFNLILAQKKGNKTIYESGNLTKQIEGEEKDINEAFDKANEEKNKIEGIQQVKKQFELKIQTLRESVIMMRGQYEKNDPLFSRNKLMIDDLQK